MTPIDLITSALAALGLALIATILDMKLNGRTKKATVLGAFSNLLLLYAFVTPAIAIYKVLFE